MELTQLPQDVVVWIILAILFAIIEMVSVGFFWMFFAIGAGLAAATAVVSDDMLAQVLVFAISSVLSLTVARPLMKKSLNVSDKPVKESNVSALIGKEVLVLDAVQKHSGRVKVLFNSEVWSAYLDTSASVAELTAGQEAVIVQVDGAKLAVKEK